MAAIFELVMEGVHDAFLIETAQAWTKYLARIRFGAEQRTDRVSDMRNYFGERRPGGTRTPGTSKAHGVFSIRIIIDPPGTKPRIDHTATAVLGMNSEMKKVVLEGASFRFDNIWLPKEVIVNTDFGRAVIALNERNEVQDVLDWSEVVRKVGISSGEKFWQRWGKGIVLQ